MRTTVDAERKTRRTKTRTRAGILCGISGGRYSERRIEEADRLEGDKAQVEAVPKRY